MAITNAMPIFFENYHFIVQIGIQSQAWTVRKMSDDSFYLDGRIFESLVDIIIYWKKIGANNITMV